MQGSSKALRKYALEFIVFISGAVVMAYELLGSRMLAPYVGTSIYVWTSLIGVILGSLSLGYHLGGRIADKKAEWRIFSAIIFFAAIFMGLTVFMKNVVVNFIHIFNFRPEYTALIASLLLFAPASVLLGAISPYSVKLRITNLESSAATVGNLYAISTVGSIVGTFAAGFFMIPFFGTTKLIFFMSIALFLLSMIAYPKTLFKLKLLFITMLLCLLLIEEASFIYAQKGITDIDTPYNRVRIEYGYDQQSKRETIVLYTDPFGVQSAMYLHDDELVFEYTKYFRLAKHFKANINKALMIGGCGYSYPKDFLNKFPSATMDVVEIDPGMTQIAQKYFKLEMNDRLNIFHEDARIFLNRTENRYDVIYGDAFNSFLSVPYHLTTKEAIEKIHKALKSDGLVIQNIESAIDGKKGEFLRAEIATYKEYFPQVYVFRVDSENGTEAQNVILVALKNNQKPLFVSDDEELNTYLQSLWKEKIQTDMPVITDDYAPVEYYKFRSI